MVSEVSPSDHMIRARALLMEIERAIDSLVADVQWYSGGLQGRFSGTTHSVGRMQGVSGTTLQRIENSSGPDTFVGGLIEGYKEGKDLRSQREAILRDIRLAESEIDKAESANPSETLECEDGGKITISDLRVAQLNLTGLVNLVWGVPKLAASDFHASNSLLPNSYAAYMIGLAYEMAYQRTEAISAYENYLQMDPIGEDSVKALRSIEELKNYKKRFRGSWGVFVLFIFLFWPAAIIYFFVKRK